MNSNIFKYFIDAIMFVIVCATGIVGVIIGYVIPGGTVPDSGKLFLSLNRNDWGSIHLFLSIVLLGMIALHLLFNIGWIVEKTKLYFGTFWLKFLGMLAGGWVVVLLISWFAVKF